MHKHDDTKRLSTFFFPLRTNTGYYESPEGYLGLLERVKQASLLYDVLVFEGGIYDSIMWDNGNWDVWHPPHTVDTERLKWMKESFRSSGDEAALFIQAEGGEPIPVFRGEVIRQFRCEFHSLLNELKGEEIPWIHIENFELTDEGKKDARSISGLIDKKFRSSLPSNKHVISLLVKNFCRDMVITTRMSAGASVHGLYAGLLAHKVGVSHAPGFVAVQVAVPNWSNLEWQELVELREHPSWVALREKLLELEITVRTSLAGMPEDEVQYKTALSQALIQELLTEIAEYQPRTGEVLGNIAMDLIIGLIPLPGTSAVFTGMRGFGEIEKAQSSWITAFLKLRQTK